MTASEALVTFRGVQKTYDGTSLVVRDLNLDIQRGEFLSLLGPSGSGKTTTLMMLAGFESATAGEICLNGQPITRTPPHKRNFGMVFQNYALFPNLTVLGNIIYGLHGPAWNKNRRGERAEELLALTGLQGLENRLPAQLSGGQQQRVAIVRAIAIKPRFLIFDEPTSALDPEMTAEVLDFIAELRNEGRNLIIVTHNMGFAREVSDRCVFVAEGRALEEGHSREVFGNPRHPLLVNFLARVLRY